MACLTNKDMSKEPFATLAWAQFKRGEKKKSWMGRKIKSLFVKGKQIWEGGRVFFLIFFYLLVSKQAFCLGQERKSEKSLINNLLSACLLTERDPCSWHWQVLPSLPSRAAQVGRLCTVVWKAGPYLSSHPWEGWLWSHASYGSMSISLITRDQISAGFETIGSP